MMRSERDTLALALRRSNELIESGNTAQDAGEIEVAYREYLEATRVAPDHARAWVNLGNALAATSRPLEAIGAFDQAIALEAGNAAAQYNRGLALTAVGHLAEAEASFSLALEARPIFPDALAALGDVLEAQGKLVEATAALRKAVEQAPDHSGYLGNLGILQSKAGNLDLAEATFRRAMLSEPSSEALALRLAGALREKGQHNEACDVLESVVELKADADNAHSSLLFTMLYRDDLSREYVFERHRRFGAAIEKRLPVRFVHDRSERRGHSSKLRVGYVSGDFRRHAVANFALPLIQGHDRRLFEVYCYSNCSYKEDITADFRRAADVWREISASDDLAIAQLINDDEIDILIDLNGHSGEQRLGVFAQRPAPIQATWLGYLNTTGVASIDYRISDNCSDPEGLTTHLHTERLARLPDSQWCYRPYISLPHVARPPIADVGFCTFGSFNQFAKISPSTRLLWQQILIRTPNSRMIVVGTPEGAAQQSLLDDFTNRGISAERIELIPRVDLAGYFRLYDRIDIALDTTPYSGATTTCDALWMAVPVVSLAGCTSASRSGVSLLSAVGLPELIAANPENYVSIATNLAQEKSRLLDYHGSLRKRMRDSVLMDEPGFVKAVEDLYKSIWQEWSPIAAMPK